MNIEIHKASERGRADYGWLKTNYSFSFANYYNSKKMHFGLLRVLNDDIIAGGNGFDAHPHQDMEIITIPLEGQLRHGDNMGNEGVITAGEVQVMSAGTGVYHSEHNASADEELRLFQIWIFTDRKGHKPRYDQKQFMPEGRQNSWQLLVSPDGRNESLLIHQDAFISQAEVTEPGMIDYELKSPGNGVFIMVVEGSARIEDNLLGRRDAIGLSEFRSPLEIMVQERSLIMAIEVPME